MTMLNKDYIPQKILSEVRVNYQQASLYALQGDKELAEAALKRIQTSLAHQQYSQQAAQFPLVMKQLYESINLLQEQQITQQAQQKELIASANEHNAGAEEKRSQARLNDEQLSQQQEAHDEIVKALKADSELKQRENRLKARTYIHDLNKAISEAALSHYDKERMRMLAKTAEQNLRIAEKENKSYYWRLAGNALKNLANAAGVFFGLKLGASRLGTPAQPQPKSNDFGTYNRYDSKSGLYY